MCIVKYMYNETHLSIFTITPMWCPFDRNVIMMCSRVMLLLSDHS